MNSFDTPGSNDVLDARQISSATVAFGAVLAALGIFAVLAPLFTGIAVTLLVGVLLLAAGVVEIVVAFKSESFGDGALKFVLGGLSVLAAFVIFATPQVSLGFLTMILALYFLIAGVADIVLAIQLRPEEGWGWMLTAGIVSIGLATLVAVQWPVSGVWAVGLYIGFRMLLHGWMLMALGRTGQVALTHLQDSRIEALERQVRAGGLELLETQAILVDHTAMLIALGDELRQKVSATDVDPAIRELNTDLKSARVELQKAADATHEAWERVQGEASESFQKLRESSAELTERLKKELGLGAKGDS
jgi:uncharacterized membrane protein HdeD (DUF308 family)/gas vesicle protein